MRKQDFCHWENKDTDQLYTDSTSYIRNLKVLAFSCDCTAQFVDCGVCCLITSEHTQAKLTLVWEIAEERLYLYLPGFVFMLAKRKWLYEPLHEKTMRKQRRRSALQEL